MKNKAYEKIMWSVNVSALEVRKDVNEHSKVILKKGTVVESTGETRQYKKEIWIEVVTLNEPKVTGYMQVKYLSKI